MLGIDGTIAEARCSEIGTPGNLKQLQLSLKKMIITFIILPYKGN
jgi:hypothetical protein